MKRFFAGNMPHQHDHDHSERIDIWDGLGLFLSALCAVHCLVLPFLILSMPILARYYLFHPLFHWLLALLIAPLGLFAFTRGYLQHRLKWLLATGLVGLALVGFGPLILHREGWTQYEPYLVSIGSVLLVYAHLKNYRSCSCATHGKG